MIGLNMSTQLGIVYMQTRKGRGWKRRMLLEMLIVVTAIKPGVDAWRVARGDEQHKHSAVDPETELAFSRASEMVFESIPGCILQVRHGGREGAGGGGGVYLRCAAFIFRRPHARVPCPANGRTHSCARSQTRAILQSVKGGARVSKAALGSICVSALTTGFASASISTDYDCGLQRRRDSPEFYGYMPAGYRGLAVFGCMVVKSTLLLLVRSLSLAQLFMTSASYVVAFLLGDIALYLAYKWARRDFHHWVPAPSAALSLVQSTLSRVVVKIAVDFAGIIQASKGQ
jgi:hypothetical protein